MYLLYPAVGFISRFDFHIEVFAIPAFIAAFLAMERKQWVWATIWLLVPLLVKENMGLTVAVFGIYAMIMPRKYRWGTAWIILRESSPFWLLHFGCFRRFEVKCWMPSIVKNGWVTHHKRCWQHSMTNPAWFGSHMHRQGQIGIHGSAIFAGWFYRLSRSS